ncbi:MAG: tetratricopeptide repeat protein [Candidatus Pacearchaeota archaeon]
MKKLIFAVIMTLISNCNNQEYSKNVKTFGYLDALNDARNTMIDLETYYRNPNFDFNNIVAIDSKWGAVMEPLQQGIINYLKGNLDSSIINYERALDDVKNLDKLFKNKSRIEALRNLEGFIFYCLGNSYLKKKLHEDALNYYECALEKFQKLKFKEGITDVKKKMAKSYKEMKKNENAAKIYREVIKMEDEIPNIIRLYREFSEVLYELGYLDSFFIYNNFADDLENKLRK